MGSSPQQLLLVEHPPLLIIEEALRICLRNGHVRSAPRPYRLFTYAGVIGRVPRYKPKVALFRLYKRVTYRQDLLKVRVGRIGSGTTLSPARFCESGSVTSGVRPLGFIRLNRFMEPYQLLGPRIVDCGWLMERNQSGR